jgi:hydroxypyruvate reductase
MAAETTLRRDALAIFKAALKAADPAEAIRRHVTVNGGTLQVDRKRYVLDRYGRILVTGAGKASARMAETLEKLLGRRISQGLINTKYGHGARLKRIELHECGHPVPDASGVEGSRRIAALAAEATADDLVLVLISGGASALMPLPADPIELGEKQETTRLLLACGATIQEINAVRKHISAIKGGQLARLASPATAVALMLSDVIGDPLDVIGSGPTAPDASTFRSAWQVIEKYALQERIPDVVRHRLEAGLLGEIDETPKPGDACFERVQNVIVGSNRLAVDATAKAARERGYRPVVLSTLIEGETRDIASMHAAILKEAMATGRPARPPVCFISGGETTVTLRGEGLGGRNQEFALACALALDGLSGALALSGGTDGTDGPTDAAGAIADGRTLERARKLGLDAAAFLACNDSYHFFDALNDLIRTGPTGTNVMDVRLLLTR